MTPGDEEPAISEEVTAETADETETNAPAPVLNREQRRAQARGKKGGTAFNPGSNANSGNGMTNRNPGGGGQVRFPRTGHK